MKQQFVSAVAVLICCAILTIAGLFGYSRYRAGQAENAEFQAQLLNTSQNNTQIATHMPGPLPAHANTASGELPSSSSLPRSAPQ